MSAELRNTGAALQGTIPLILQTSTSPLPTALSSSLFQTEKTQSATNNSLEKCDTTKLKLGNEAGCQQNDEIRGRNCYRVTLMVSTEQETAIIDLFSEKQWIYIKLEDDSVLTGNVRSSTPDSKDPEIIFFKENEAFHSPIDNQFSFDCDSNEKRNRYIQSSLSSRQNMKKILAIKEQDIAGITANPMHQDSLEEAKYVSRKISGITASAMENNLLDSDIPPSSTNLSTNAPEFEQEQQMISLKNSVKTESQSNCTDVLVKPENEFKVPAIVAPEGISNCTKDDGLSKRPQSDMAHIESVFKMKKSTPNNKTNIYCKDCQHTFKFLSVYERHLKEDKCKHTCQFCGKVFLYGNTSGYKLHIKYHRKQRDHECEICGKQFIDKSKMEQHVKLHTNPKPKICERCGKGFPTTTSLRLHMENMHIEKKDLLQCSKCAKMYTNKSSLWYHMRAVHEIDCNVSFSCSICDKSFKQKRLLTLHELTHKETKDFKCNRCDQSFKRSSDLSNHQRRHRKAYTVFCKTCNKGFYEKRKLKDHENIHTGFKPYHCSICDFRCAFKTNLPKHMKIHRDASNTQRI